MSPPSEAIEVVPLSPLRVLAGWLVGAALSVALMVAVSFWSFQQIEAAAEARQHNNAVLANATEVLAAMVDAETGQRGYLLTGEDPFLAPYLEAQARVQAGLAQLGRGNATTLRHLVLLRPLIDTKLDFFAKNIELRRSGDLPAALVNVKGAGGKPLMDSVRAELDALVKDLELDRDARETEFQASMRQLYATLIISSVITLLIALCVAWFIHRESSRKLQSVLHAVTRRTLESQEKIGQDLLQANTTLQVSEEKLSVTLNSIGDGVIATDAQGLVTVLNPLAQKLTGWTLAEAKGRPITEVFRIISEETRQPATVPVIAALAHGTTQGLANHTVLLSRKGTECSIADSCAPIRERNGKVVGAVLVFRDVTEEHTVQKALRDLQFYTRSLIESNVDALMTTDALGVITDANKPMEVLTGHTRAELIGSTFKSHFTDPARADAGINLVLSTGKVSDYELTAHASGGAQTVVSYNAVTFSDRHGKLQGVFAAARDITERKRLDQVLNEKNAELEKATAVAEKANQAKSEFLSSMSHELRSPLNAILGFAQLMETDSVPPTATQRVQVAQILKAGWHLLTLINEILDLARVESGQVPLSQEPVSVAEVLLECQGMIGPQAQVRGIELHFPKETMPLFVRADRTRLKQVLINLLSNAIKYNTKSGSVTVTCRQATPTMLRVSVFDTGLGLSTEQVSQLFQAFNRLGQESRGEEGTGIGLVVSKRLIELMGGKIGVKSTVGEGSEFWFELASIDGPKLSAEDTALVARASPPRHLAAARSVLYVEDNPANLLLVKQILARMPSLRLLTATDGYAGIEVARASLPDVILMDINLPGVNGVEAMKILRSDPRTSMIPVVALSANALPRDVEKGLAAGFFRYITKPLKVNEFVQALTHALAEAKT